MCDVTTRAGKCELASVPRNHVKRSGARGGEGAAFCACYRRAQAPALGFALEVPAQSAQFLVFLRRAKSVRELLRRAQKLVLARLDPVLFKNPPQSPKKSALRATAVVHVRISVFTTYAIRCVPVLDHGKKTT
jgi:hypothetical protein